MRNSNGKCYIGYSGKIPEERKADHNQGKCEWTRGKGPWGLIYSEQFDSKAEAYKRERQIKKYKGGRAFKELIKIQ